VLERAVPPNRSEECLCLIVRSGKSWWLMTTRAPYVVVACAECLRTFQLTVAEETAGDVVEIHVTSVPTSTNTS